MRRIVAGPVGPEMRQRSLPLPFKLSSSARLESAAARTRSASSARPRPDLPQALDRNAYSTRRPPVRTPPRPEIVPASHTEPAALPDRAGVDDLVALAVARNPRLAKATFAIDSARGRHIQAGLYPNPELAINWDEVGDRTGPGGSSLRRGSSRPSSPGESSPCRRPSPPPRSIGPRSRSQRTLCRHRRGPRRLLRRAYSGTPNRGARPNSSASADEAVRNGKNLFDNQKIARLDLVQLEIERERFCAEAEAASRELPAARRALAATIGDPRLRVANLTAAIETLPLYDADRDARRGAGALIRRFVRRGSASNAPRPRSTSAGRGYPGRDGLLGLHSPGPEQSRTTSCSARARHSGVEPQPGNIRAAQAELGEASQEVARVENDLADRSRLRFARTPPHAEAPRSIAYRESFRRPRKPTTCRSRRSRAASSTYLA